jgi:hypothetical protein
MDRLLKFAGEFSSARYDLRTLIVVIWLFAGWRIAITCIKRVKVKPEMIPA